MEDAEQIPPGDAWEVPDRVPLAEFLERLRKAAAEELKFWQPGDGNHARKPNASLHQTSSRHSSKAEISRAPSTTREPSKSWKASH